MTSISNTMEQAVKDARFQQSIANAVARSAANGISEDETRKNIRAIIIDSVSNSSDQEKYLAILDTLIPAKTKPRAVESTHIPLSPCGDMEIVNY